MGYKELDALIDGWLVGWLDDGFWVLRFSLNFFNRTFITMRSFCAHLERATVKGDEVMAILLFYAVISRFFYTQFPLVFVVWYIILGRLCSKHERFHCKIWHTWAILSNLRPKHERFHCKLCHHWAVVSNMRPKL